MVFSEFYRGSRSPLTKLRHSQLPVTHLLPAETPDWVSDEYADLLSKDKATQKDAVKRYLNDKVKTNWEFSWPPSKITCKQQEETTAQPDEKEDTTTLKTEDNVLHQTSQTVQDEICDDTGYQVDAVDSDEQIVDDENDEKGDNDDAESVYSIVSEDGLHYRPRAEWTSDLSDDNSSISPFRFDTPDAVGTAVEASTQAKRARRRRAIRDEMSWNEGLACFEARRNAWTGARTVRVRSKPVSPPAASPRSPRRFFFRRSMSGSPPGTTLPQALQVIDVSEIASDGSSIAKDNEKELKKQSTKDSTQTPLNDSANVYPVETLLPIGQPLLPPNNSLRASITPPIYLSLYDKVILHNLQPSCPINLADMLRSCVAGWKRDGEWPPRPSGPEASLATRRKKKKTTATIANGGDSGANASGPRRLSFGILNREKDDESRAGKGIRRSLQRALGIGSAPGTPGTPSTPGLEKL